MSLSRDRLPGVGKLYANRLVSRPTRVVHFLATMRIKSGLASCPPNFSKTSLSARSALFAAAAVVNHALHLALFAAAAHRRRRCDTTVGLLRRLQICVGSLFADCKQTGRPEFIVNSLSSVRSEIKDSERERETDEEKERLWLQ